MERLCFQQGAGFGGTFGRGHFVTVGAEILGDRVPEIGLVLDDDNSCPHYALAPAFSGK